MVNTANEEIRSKSNFAEIQFLKDKLHYMNVIKFLS